MCVRTELIAAGVKDGVRKKSSNIPEKDETDGEVVRLLRAGEAWTLKAAAQAQQVTCTFICSYYSQHKASLPFFSHCWFETMGANEHLLTQTFFIDADVKTPPLTFC